MDNFVYYPWKSESFFWSCLTLSHDCPFYCDLDPQLFYFGLGIATLYCGFLVIVLCDLCFYWSIDKLQNQVDYYINLVRTKVNQVQTDQRRLTSVKVRTEKLLKSSQESTKLVTVLRSALNASDPQYLNMLTKKLDDVLEASHITESTNDDNNNKAWSDVTPLMDF